MTSQYTQTSQILPSQLMANAFSSKSQNYANVSSEAFSSVLDNASKSYSYADKSTNMSSTANDYAQKTKDLNSQKTEVKKDNNDNSNKIKDKETSDKIDEKDSLKSDDKNITDKSDYAEKNDNTHKADKEDKADKKDNTQTSEQEKDNDVKSESNTQEVSDKDIKNNAQSELQNQTTQALNAQQAVLVSVEVSAEAATATAAQTTAQTDVQQDSENTVTAVAKTTEAVIDTQNSKDSVNTIVNEQILSNIEYEDLSAVDTELKKAGIDAETLKKIVEQAKNTQNSDTAQIVQDVPSQEKTDVKLADTLKTAQTVKDVAENINTQVSSEAAEVKAEVKNNTALEKEAQTLPLKTAKDNLAADTSRLTANIEQAETAQNAAPAPVTPADTKAEESPVIKVTQEVASQLKDNVAQNTSQNIENKDTTSKTKDKAVEQMTKLQDTDTVVTEARTQADNSNSNGGNSNGSTNMPQGTAGELAAKLSVDAAPTNTSGAEAFVNKLDAQLSAKGASATARTTTLNQSDIMSQVNAKFEELQKSGNNKVSIILQPENLGKVSVEIMNSKDGIVAKMTTDSQQVKELFDKNVEALKSNLSSQGVNVNNIKVECSQESANHAMNFEQQQFNQSFNGQQNSHNQANQSHQQSNSAYESSYETSSQEAEPNQGVEIKNTDTLIKHNGKVDYSV